MAEKWVAVREDELNEVLAMARTLCQYHAPTRLCPSCKEYFLEEGLVCPGCRHDDGGHNDDNYIVTADITIKAIGPKQEVVDTKAAEKRAKLRQALKEALDSLK